MAKSKNHTNHNQNRKAHRNGIKKPKRFRHESQLGAGSSVLLCEKETTEKRVVVLKVSEKKMKVKALKLNTRPFIWSSVNLLVEVTIKKMDAKFLKNLKFAKKHNLSTKAQLKKAAENRAKAAAGGGD